MKEIKIFMQYPWKSGDSSYYKNILDFPSKDIEFVNYSKDNAKKFEIIGSSKKFEQVRKLKNTLRKILGFLKIPNLTYSRHSKNFDLIHCAHCLSLNKKPWVIDTETYDRIAATGNIAYSKIGKWIIRNRLESKYCKKIICWSKDCIKTFEEAFPGNKKILDKIKLLHFAMPEPKINNKKHKKLRVLFVARWFEAKGGLQTLEVFDRLSKKYSNVEFIFICSIPKKIKDKYSENKKLKLLELMPQDKLLNEIYPTTDIFFYPGFGDSYGFATPEALAYGLPVITTNTFAKNEQIIDGYNGFLIDMPVDWRKNGGYSNMDENMIKEFVNKTSILIEDKKLKLQMSKNAKEHWNKMFTIEQRNKKLMQIYKGALN